MAKLDDITSFIIAGGESKRFGQDKLLVEYKGMALIRHVSNILKNIFKDIIIIANNKEKFSFLNLPVFPDLIPKGGPLGGIYTALKISVTHKIFCFAADMPNLNPEFIVYMASIADDHDIVAPYFKSFYEPMHTIYTKNCLSHIEKDLFSGILQIFNFYKKCNLRKVEESEIKKFGEPEILFKNINLVDDIEE